MKTEKLAEIRTLRAAAAKTAGFWEKWRTDYLADSRCDKKGASFTSNDDRFSGFRFMLMFENHAGYYGNSSCSTVFNLDNDLARKYFTRAIQEMAEPLFKRASEMMLADAAKLTDEAEAEIAALQAMLDEVRQAGRDTDRSGEADETAQQAQPEAREPGSEGHRPNTPSQSREPSK